MTGIGREGIRDESGYSLIEVLVAIMLLVTGVLGTAHLVASSEASSLDTELQQVATEEAEQAIEEVRALDYDEIGHGALGLPNAGQPYQAPDAPGPEDIVELGSGNGIAPSRSFTVSRGPGQPEVTGTIETFVTWRDEECSVLDLGGVEGVSNILAVVSDLRASIAPLQGPSGRVLSIINGLTSTLLSILPGNNDTLLKSELNQIKPLLDTAYTQVVAAEALLDDLESLDIDLCDLEPAELASLQTILETGTGTMAGLTGDLVDLNAALVALQGPLNNLLGQLSGLVCTLLPSLCNSVQTAINGALAVLVPGTGDPPKTLLGAVNTTLTELTSLDISGLDNDTTHNTKRITVAVTIDTLRDDITPKNTVFMSTVVTDPEAGLLIDAELIP